MKSLRSLCLAVVAAVALVVLVGVGSASATSLCKEKAEVCPKGKNYPTGTIFRFALQKEATLKFASILPVECEASTTVDVLLEGTNPLFDEVTTWTAAKCQSGKKECTFTAYNTPYTSEIEYGVLPTFVLRAVVEGEEPRYEVKCSNVPACKYGAKEEILDFEGGQPAQVVAKEESFKLVEGPESSCGATSKMSATYLIQEAEIGKEVIKTPPVFVSK
jgi:hypothetical protein